jgi:mRNA interferase HicA
VKRSSLLQHLRRHGCVLKREGRGLSLWTNPATGLVEAVPRHTEIANVLDGLSIPEVGSDDRTG